MLRLETLDKRVSHSCACVCSAMAIVCACGERDLYISLYGGFSFNDTSWAISAMMWVWKLPVMLITFGIISTCSRPLLCCIIACLSGSYIVCMLSIMTIMLMFVEYLHSKS